MPSKVLAGYLMRPCKGTQTPGPPKTASMRLFSMFALWKPQPGRLPPEPGPRGSSRNHLMCSVTWLSSFAFLACFLAVPSCFAFLACFTYLLDFFAFHTCFCSALLIYHLTLSPDLLRHLFSYLAYVVLAGFPSFLFSYSLSEVAHHLITKFMS